ncbi:hypothetical protein ACIGXI_09070 [Kitasatospora aureofaciens]|uniref:hypothetical protein n=1 Tax=Kitasatospora aureofaciens TaxID=1894 RepID=UPI0037C5D5DE
MFSHQSVPSGGPQAVTLAKTTPVTSENAPAPMAPRSRRLPLQLTVGILASAAVGFDLELGRRLGRAGMDLAQVGIICAGLLAIPALVALTVVMWSADRLESAPRN